MNKKMLEDNRLSLKAKGLYTLISSFLTSEGYLNKQILFEHCLEGDKAFESAWKELKSKGYLIQHRLQEEGNKNFYYRYELK